MMLESKTYLFLNLLIYVGLTWWAYRYTKGVKATVIIFAYYAFSAVATILFYDHPLTLGSEFDREINLASLMFLASLTFIIAYPVTVFDRKETAGRVYAVSEKPIITFLAVMLFMQVVSYIAYLPYFMTVWNSTDLEALRDDVVGEETGIHAGVPGLFVKIFVYGSWLRNLAVPIAFYALLFIKNHRKFIIIATLSTFFFPMYYSMLYAMRSQIYLQIVTLVFFFVILRQYISRRAKIILVTVGGVFLLFAVVTLIMISNGRFGSMANWMYYRYMGESFINFSTLWQDQSGYTEGMAYFKKFITGEEYPTTVEKWDYIRYKTGVDAHVFNTSVGQLMIEFGGFVTALIYLAIGLVTYRFFKSQKGVTVSGLLMLGLLSQFYFYGLYVFPFQGMGMIQMVLYIALIIYFNRPQKLLKLTKQRSK